jgi:two-component system, NtrC family, sensor kinase
VNPLLRSPGAAHDPVGAIAGSAAHEIGTALTAIQVAAERLERRSTREGDGIPSELRVIQDQSERLRRLARNLLELARPNPAVDAGFLSLSEHVQRVLDPVARDLGREGVDLSLYLSPETPHWVRGNPHRLSEVLLALVQNARKAATSASPSIDGTDGVPWIRVLVGRAKGGSAEIRIRDSGPGVRPEDEERIFYPFVSLWGGEGLGLSRSRVAATGFGGGLRLERLPDGGSEFVLTLETMTSIPAIVPDPPRTNGNGARIRTEPTPEPLDSE